MIFQVYHWHHHAYLFALARGTTKKWEPWQPCATQTAQGQAWNTTCSVLHLGRLATDPVFLRLHRLNKQRSVLYKEELHNSHWSKHHSSATCRGGALRHSFTFSDFLCGPVAQIFRQDFAHIAIFWKQLNHLQASGSRWEESKEQTSYISSIKSSSTDFRTQASLCFTQGAWQRSPKLGVLAPTFSTGIKKWPSTLSHTPENSRITDSKLQTKMLNILVSYWNPAEVNSKSLFRKLYAFNN